MATAAALGTGIGILAIVHFAAVASLFLFLLQLGKALLFFGGALGDAVVHLLHVDVLDTETSGKQGDFHFLFQLVVNGHTEFGFEVAAETVHELLHLVHLAHHQLVLCTVRDVEEYFLGVEDVVVVQQRRVLRVLDGFADTVVTFAVAGTHDGYAAVLQHCFHVVEVEVHLSMQGDDFGNTLGGYRKGVVGLVKRVVYG